MNHDQGTPAQGGGTNLSGNAASPKKVLLGGTGNDTLTASTDGAPSNQWHIYSGPGDDVITMDLSVKGSGLMQHGHHTFSEAGRDVLRFVGIDGIKDTVMGRIDDFNPAMDIIMIGDEVLDLNAPENIRGADVYFTSMENLGTPGLEKQTWLVIETAKGRAIYVLDGARVVDDANDGEERHFLQELAKVPAVLPRVAYEDPMNHPLADDDPVIGRLKPQIWATGKDDTFRATIGPAYWFGQGGNDNAVGGAGNDLLDGGAGRDTLLGGAGNDTLMGQAGSDKLHGGAGNDLIAGGKGNDLIQGEAGNDRIYGGLDKDTIDGGAGDDTVYGGSEADNISGAGGNDLIFGNAGNDVLRGGAGNDTLSGGDGDDLLDGNDGRDIIDAGNGNDAINATPGDIVFSGAGKDVIRVISMSQGGLGPVILGDLDKADQIRVPAEQGKKPPVMIGRDEAGNIVLANISGEALIVIGAHASENFSKGVIVGAGEVREMEDVMPGDLYKAGLEAAQAEDHPVWGVMGDGSDGGSTGEPDAPEAPASPESPEQPEGRGDEEDEDGREGSGDGSCFVATAAYGSARHADVVRMRRFRDEVLVRSAAGRAAVRLYWAAGPALARKVSPGGVSGKAARAICRMALRLRG